MNVQPTENGRIEWSGNVSCTKCYASVESIPHGYARAILSEKNWQQLNRKWYCPDCQQRHDNNEINKKNFDIIWEALHEYRESCIPEGAEEYDDKWGDIAQAMNNIQEELGYDHYNQDGELEKYNGVN